MQHCGEHNGFCCISCISLFPQAITTGVAAAVAGSSGRAGAGHSADTPPPPATPTTAATGGAGRRRTPAGARGETQALTLQVQ